MTDEERRYIVSRIEQLLTDRRKAREAIREWMDAATVADLIVRVDQAPAWPAYAELERTIQLLLVEWERAL